MKKLTPQRQYEAQKEFIEKLDWIYRRAISEQQTHEQILKARRELIFEDSRWERLADYRKSEITAVGHFLSQKLQRDWLVWGWQLSGRRLPVTNWDSLTEEEKEKITTEKVKGQHFWIGVASDAHTFHPMIPSFLMKDRQEAQVTYRVTNKAF